MTLRTRRIIFFLFVFAFFVSAPIIILYTAGYRYNWKSGSLTQTGVLSVETVPRAVLVFVDDKTYRERTPVVINNITPGDYLIRLEKDEYLPWQKTLSIKSRETTFISNAALFLDTPAALMIENLKILDLHQATGQIAYVDQQDEWAEVWINDTNSKKLTLLARLVNSQPLEIEAQWSFDGAAIALKTNSKQDPLYSLIDLENNQRTSISDLLPSAAAGFWDAAGNQYYVKSKLGLTKIEMNSNQIETLPASTIAAINDSRGLTTMQKVADKLVVSRNTNGTEVILGYLPLGNYRLYPAPNGLILFYDQEKQQLVLLDANGGDQPILVNTQAVSWQWSPDGAPRLLYSDGFSLLVYDVLSHQSDTITRLSTPIIDLAWDTESETVFFATANGITAIELDFRDKHITTTLANQENINRIWLSRQGDTLFFETSDGRVSNIFERGLRK